MKYRMTSQDPIQIDPRSLPLPPPSLTLQSSPSDLILSAFVALSLTPPPFPLLLFPLPSLSFPISPSSPFVSSTPISSRYVLHQISLIGLCKEMFGRNEVFLFLPFFDWSVARVNRAAGASTGILNPENGDAKFSKFWNWNSFGLQERGVEKWGNEIHASLDHLSYCVKNLREKKKMLIRGLSSSTFHIHYLFFL